MPRAPRLPARFALVLAAALVATALAACDDGPGPPPLDRAPPTVSDLQLTPRTVDYTGAEPVVQVPLQLSVAVDEGSGGVTARFVVRRPFAPGALAEGLLTPADGRYAGAATLELPRGAVGDYVVTVVASGTGGVGNEATALLRFSSTSFGAPALDAAGVDPNPVPVPGAFTVAADVSDPDGLANVARVVLASGGAEFQLCDDGNFGACGFGGVDLPGPSGDAAAGDGRYSRRFQVADGTPPGEVGFTVQAFDRIGEASAAVPLTVTLQ
jgi:hypothetical protein